MLVQRAFKIISGFKEVMLMSTESSTSDDHTILQGFPECELP